MRAWKVALLMMLAWSVVTACQTAAVDPGARTVRYTVRIGDPNDQVFEISMTIPSERGTLTLHLPATTPGDVGYKQHARYLDHFKARDPRGTEMEYRRVGAQTWEVDVSEPMEVEVLYRIHMNERDLLRLGSNAIGPRGGFLEGSSVFLYSVGHMDDPVEARYLLPENWTLVPLLPSPEAGVLTARDYRTLVDAPVQFGEIQERSIVVGDLTIRLVFDHPLPTYDEAAFDANIRAILEEIIGLFGSRPFSDYTILAHWRPDLDFGGGLEHGRAMVLNIGSQWMIDLPVNAAGTIAHEMFHAWNGEAFHPVELHQWDFAGPDYSRHLWFVEGVTSYFATLTLVRSGVIPTRSFFSMMSRSIANFEADPGRGWTSLEEAGAAAWIFSPDALDYYGGGEVVGFLLDVTLRLDTAGERGLDDVMRLLYARSLARGYRGYDDAQLKTAVDEVAGHDMSSFFDQYVTGRRAIEYAPLLRRAGLEVSRPQEQDDSSNISIRPLANQTPDQERLWSRLLRGHRSGSGS